MPPPCGCRGGGPRRRRGHLRVGVASSLRALFRGLEGGLALFDIYGELDAIAVVARDERVLVALQRAFELLERERRCRLAALALHRDELLVDLAPVLDLVEGVVVVGRERGGERGL